MLPTCTRGLCTFPTTTPTVRFPCVRGQKNDLSYKCTRSRKPNLFSFTLAPICQEGILVIGTDGLWGSVTSEEAAMVVSQCRREGRSAREATEKLCKTAEKQGSKDNVAAVVWYL